MIKLSHDTWKTTEDENNNCQRICIDAFSSTCNKCYTVYEGKRYSCEKDRWSDPRHEQMCIVKFPATSHGTEPWAKLEKRNSEMARKAIVDFFRRVVTEDGAQITFLLPQYTSLESVATLCKKRCKNEYVVCEDKLHNFKHFINSRGEDVKSSSARNNKKLLRRQSSKVQTLKSSTSCNHQHRRESTSLEMARPAEGLDNILTPTCPPYEEDNPPSYDDIFGPLGHSNYLFQADNRNFNNGNNNNNAFYFPISSQFNLNQYINHVPLPAQDCSPAVQSTDIHSRTERTNSIRQEENDNYPHPLLRALVHYFFYHTKGQKIVCNLKGTCQQENQYTLTTPIIHSLTRTCGERDEGEIGIIRVIDNHRCSKWCRHLRSMREIFEEAQLNAISQMSLH